MGICCPCFRAKFGLMFWRPKLFVGTLLLWQHFLFFFWAKFRLCFDDLNSRQDPFSAATFFFCFRCTVYTRSFQLEAIYTFSSALGDMHILMFTTSCVLLHFYLYSCHHEVAHFNVYVLRYSFASATLLSLLLSSQGWWSRVDIWYHLYGMNNVCHSKHRQNNL